MMLPFVKEKKKAGQNVKIKLLPVACRTKIMGNFEYSFYFENINER